MNELDEYSLDLYGECKLGLECSCIQPIKRTSPIEFPLWLGRICPNWQPLKGEYLAALRKASQINE
jgi:hypothetical protein